MRLRRTPSHGRQEDGALLVEVVVGMGLLALVLAGIGPMHHAARDAADRSLALLAAVASGDLIAEAETLEGSDTEAHRGAVIGVELATPIDVDLCSGAPGSASVLHVDIGPESRPQTARIRLASAVIRGGEPVVVAPGSPVRVRIPAELEDVGADLVASGGGAVHVADAPSGVTCRSFPRLPSGAFDLQVVAPSVDLIDATHVGHAERPHPLTIGTEPAVATLDIRLATVLSATVTAEGARKPDLSSPGPLRWMVRESDAAVALPSGASRSVAPGRVTVGVSACAEMRSAASVVRHEIAGPGPHAVDVPLATVRLRNVGSRSDATLQAIRTTACTDGSGQRPLLRWDGELRDGLQVALPHGVWQFRLQTAAGSPLTFPVTVGAGEPGAEVVFP